MTEGRATLGRRLLWTYCVLTLLFLCAPIVIVVIVSFNATEFIQFPPQTWSLRWYRNYFGARQWVEPTLLSLRIAAVTMVLAIFLGGPNTTTLPKRMWESVRFEIDPTLTAISTLLVLIPIAILAVVEVVRRSSAAVPAPEGSSLSPAEGERAG